MKVYSISRWAFWGICILILALPVSRHWRLLTSGEKVEGTVIRYSRHLEKVAGRDMIMVEACEIVFPVGDSTCLTYGPVDLFYEPGRTLTLRYDRKDPSRNCLVTFEAFYLTDYSILPMVLLIVWAAFYLSFNYYRKKPAGRGKVPASSPYREWKEGPGRGKEEAGKAGGTPRISP